MGKRKETNKLLKKEYIERILKEYSKPVKVGTKNKKDLLYQPTEEDIKQYQKELEKLSIKQLRNTNLNKEAKTKTPISFMLGKLRRKTATMITIHGANNTRHHYIISKWSRFAKIKNRAYVMIPNFARLDSLYKIPVLEYFENNPLPIEFIDDRPASTPDTSYLKEALHFQYATALAKITEMMSKANLAVIFSLLAFVCALGSAVLSGLIAHHLNIF